MAATSRSWLLNDLGLLGIRAMVGVVMTFHGAQKLLGWWGGKGIEGFQPFVEGLGSPFADYPLIFTYAAAVSEFGGGLLLIIGLLTPISALAVAGTMGVASFMVHAGKFSLQDGGMEYSLTLMVLALCLIFTGPGMFSIDRMFFRKKKKEPAKD
ncbi:DoxX family protein [Calycomorphotria hydatis]|uniref:Oxidoreductase MhqP n=1 Tax=Calycomorphotria hydatis TaxID=2528027 RepID=A0A517TBB1_9PLAN|nr:DoxX family protein [Calycomorphotria hydatis]QDT65662.1 Putative oxidoreductase MhqP [Calycomorphotria hydatis]